MEHHLFVYGTLLESEVQLAVLGRVVAGTPDKLAGYKKAGIRLEGQLYPIIKPAAGSVVAGLVIAVSPAELKLIDDYEGEAYRRTRVTLVSGRQVWVYQG